MSGKYLILTASIGAGHIRAAEAVRDALQKKLPRADIPIIDCTERHISLFSWLQKIFYLKMLALVPNLYDIFYRLAGGKSAGHLARLAFALTLLPGVCAVLRKYRPDTVICTHPFPAGAAALGKKLAVGNYTLAIVLTDYSVHEVWLYRQADVYFTATEEMQRTFVAAGFPASCVHPVGIPVSGNIITAPTQAEAKAKLHIPPHNKVVLLMGGGLGLGHMEATLAALNSLSLPLTVLAITGKNKRLQARLEKFAASVSTNVALRLWGYTDQIPLLMSAADVLITKPGALTMSEAMIGGLPLILVEPIPGPEADNAKFAVSAGAAIWPKAQENLAAVVDGLLRDEQRLAALSQAARKIAKPQAAEQIASRLMGE